MPPPSSLAQRLRPFSSSGRRSRLLLAAATSTAVTFAATAVAAAPKETATLHYRAAPGCPDEEAFRHRVAARLGYDPFVSSGAREIDVKVVVAGKKLSATTVLRVRGKSDAVRTLDDAADHCDALTETVAASVATVFDPGRNGTATRPSEKAEPASAGIAADASREDGARANRSEREEIVKVAASGVGAHDARTRLRVESDWPGSELHRKLGTSYGAGTVNGRYASVAVVHTERLCRAPCTADVPTEGEYYVDAPGMMSQRLSIPPTSRRLDAHVTGAAAWPLGLALYGGVGLGGALALTGVILLAATDSSAAAPLTGVGLVLLAGGITALVALPRTRIESTDGARLDAQGKRPPNGSVTLTPQGFVF